MNRSHNRSWPWLFSATVDLWTFLGSAVLALGLLLLGYGCGWLDAETPEWLWIAAVVLVDVAHVYATAFRVYFDSDEFRRRAWLYTLVPVLAFVIGAAVYSEGAMLFWRTLAYLAVFHFVRQQYGWVALYRAKAGEHDLAGKWVDSAAIYLATIYPLIYWHCYPRQFAWFVKTDFAQLPIVAERIVAPVYWAALGLYAIRSFGQAFFKQRFNPGKDLVVTTTALCWYVGIVSVNSDYAFTVTNVITHGIPYMVLVVWYREKHSLSETARQTTGHKSPAAPNSSLQAGPQRENVPMANRPMEGSVCISTKCKRVVLILVVLWLLAFTEELFWDRGLWHERSWLFGPAWEIGNWDQVLVPLLAVPQITHYILDGFIWRRRSNPEIAQAMLSNSVLSSSV